MTQRLLFLLIVIQTIVFCEHANAQAPTITSAQTLPIGGSSSLTRVAYGNGVYATGGSYSPSPGLVYYSTNGTSWQRTASGVPADAVFHDFTFGNGAFVAVGYRVTGPTSMVLRSTDGINWTEVASGAPSEIYRVTYLDSKFWATGQGFVFTSANGSSWASITDPDFSTYRFQQVFKAGSTYYMGARDANGNNAYLYSSTTGLSNSWTLTQLLHPNNPTQYYSGLNFIDYVNGKFYMGDAMSYLLSSTNGTTWTDISSTSATISTGGSTFMGGTPTFSGTQVFSVLSDGTSTYFYGYYIAVGGYSGVAKLTGSTYTVYPRSTKLVGTNLSYVNGRFFWGGNDGIVSSTDGITFSYPDGGTWLGLAFNGSTYVKVGNTGSAEAVIMKSSDFINWQNVTGSLQETNLTDVVWGGGKFVAVGSVGRCAVSSNGTSWTFGSLDNTTITFNSVAYGNGRYVAVGNSGKISYSSDGLSWTSAQINSALGTLFGVKYVNNLFIAMGGGTNVTTGVSTLQYSSDGITWTTVSGLGSFLARFHDVDWDGTNYVLTGVSNEGSANSQFFTIKTSNIASINTADVKKIATTATGGVMLGSAGAGRNSVIYSNNTWMVGANQKGAPSLPYFLSSSDGITFTPYEATSTFASNPTSLIYSGSQFLAMGTRSAQFTLATTSLPIKLTSFSGQRSGTANVLSWATALEQNAREFIIERSGAEGTFKAIGTIPVKGFSSTYKFSDPASSDVCFYRLRLVDKDNSFSYSKVVKIENSAVLLKIYPNPANGKVLHLQSAANEGVVSIYDAEARLIRVQHWKQGQDISIDVLPLGQYLLELRAEGNEYRVSFLRN